MTTGQIQANGNLPYGLAQEYLVARTRDRSKRPPRSDQSGQ